MTTSFDASSLPRHIRIERGGRTRDGELLATMVCTVCGEDEDTPDTPAALHTLAGRFVRDHMECTPTGVDEE